MERARRSRRFQALLYDRVFVFSFLPALIFQLATRKERMRRMATAKMSRLASMSVKSSARFGVAEISLPAIQGHAAVSARPIYLLAAHQPTAKAPESLAAG